MPARTMREVEMKVGNPNINALNVGVNFAEAFGILRQKLVVRIFHIFFKLSLYAN
jgi:hypothetical protein